MGPVVFLLTEIRQWKGQTSRPNGVIYGIDTVLVPPGLDVPGFLETCQATDPPVPAPTTPLTLAPQPEPTPARTPSPTTKSSKKGRSRNPSRRPGPDPF